jgi:hypothetical protein
MRSSCVRSAPSRIISISPSERPRRGTGPRSVRSCEQPVISQSGTEATILTPQPAKNYRCGPRYAPRRARFQALADWAKKAGANTSVTNDSIGVGVVFIAERFSCGARRPELPAFHISISNLAKFFGMPVCTKAGSSIMKGTCI